MWLYVPNISTSSPSAQVDSASISASSWQFQALEQSAWSRGKPSRSRNWYQQCKRAIWLQRLFGAMPEPSMAAHGVVQLTASLVASRASLIVSPDASKARTTNATSGLTLAGSSSSRAHGSSSLKTSPACSRRGLTKSLAQSGFAETFTSLASRWREDCSRRQKLARRTRESASLSLAWPTPTANDWKGSGPTLERKDGQMRGDRLDYATEQLWATPCARDHMPAHSVEYIEAKRAEGHGMKILPDQVSQWSTPSVADVQGGRKSRSGDRDSELLMNGQADQLCSHLDPTTSTVGEAHSRPRRSLNPHFVEWLMGWPPGWTLLAWTDFGCSGMELSHWKQRMRSALLSLGLPQEAPPAQLALFG